MNDKNTDKSQEEKDRIASVRGGMFPGIELPDFICPCCGKLLTAEWIEHYKAIKKIALKRAWEVKGDSWREAVRDNFRKANEKRNQKFRERTEAQVAARKKNAAIAAQVSLEHRRQLQEEAVKSPEARKRLRAHLMVRLRNELSKKYMAVKPLLADIEKGCVIAPRKDRITLVSSTEDVRAYMAASVRLSGNTLYKMNMVMDDGRRFGAIYVRTSQNANSAALWVYEVPIPDDIPDVPDEAMPR